MGIYLIAGREYMIATEDEKLLLRELSAAHRDAGKCESCRYFVESKSNEFWGECHVNPPTVVSADWYDGPQAIGMRPTVHSGDLSCKFHRWVP